MNANSQQSLKRLAGLLTAIALVAVGLAGCGGGGGGVDAGTGSTSSSGFAQSTSTGGKTESAKISSLINGTDYNLNIYLPPTTAGARGDLPVIYMLDGESWFRTAVDFAESTSLRFIIVAIDTMGQRARDFVPTNACTPGGNGQDAYLSFLRSELIPYIEATFGGSPTKRALFGHSHGGSFVLYALFAEPPAQHTFKSYLASEASLGCLQGESDRWEQNYATAYRDLPVRLHLSTAAGGNYGWNLNYANLIAQRNYAQLTFVYQPYGGTHTVIVPQVLADAIPFAFASSP